ncbi:hypothetical protein GGR58DRAFT_134770 [Xylaria digitata]|nr:hypothetical protein GGR58DRAFT_134770 [Xylaria digitata]
MSDTDLYISSGECFYGEGQISDPRFIPCGNAAVAGTQACCFQGDYASSDYGADRSQRGSETPSFAFISPQSTGSTEKPQPGAAGGHQRTEPFNMDPISEHHFDNRQYP